MDLTTYLGLTAAALTTISFLPQAWKTWRSRSAGDISLGMYSIFCTGVALWLVYGIITKDAAIIVANAITFPVASSVLAMGWYYRKRDGQEHERVPMPGSGSGG